MNSFSDFGLKSTLLHTLKENKIFKPTEIQSLAIPLMMSSQTVVGISETGSGKTLTYALPLLHTLKSLEEEGSPVKKPSAPRALVMVPTRELGEQVSKVFKLFTHKTRLRVRSALGGMTFEQTRRSVAEPFEILLATPGRLVQLIEKDLVQLYDVRLVIFDEADQMLDQGFLPDADMIIQSCPKDIQLSLFSATVSPTVQDLINKLFSQAEIIRTTGSGKIVKNLTTQNRKVIDGKRWPLLEKILREPVKKDQSGTLLFTNTREQCDALAEELTEHGYKCAVYRGEMDKNERRSNLKKFRSGEIQLLVSTDLAARGLDIDQVGRVINYHLPKQKENYLHRAGRTARAGKPGLVINLVTERDERLIAALENRKYEKKQGPRERASLSEIGSKKVTPPKNNFKKPVLPATNSKPLKSKNPKVKFVPKPKPKSLIEFEKNNKPKKPLSDKIKEKIKKFRSYGPKK